MRSAGSATQGDPRLVARHFELHLLGMAGFAPSLHYCGVGQEEITAQDQYFSPVDGGVVCPDHRGELGRGMPLTLNALKTMRYLQTRPWDAVKVLQLSTPLHMELEQLLMAYITYLLERRLQSVDFLRRLRRENL